MEFMTIPRQLAQDISLTDHCTILRFILRRAEHPGWSTPKEFHLIREQHLASSPNAHPPTVKEALITLRTETTHMLSCYQDVDRHIISLQRYQNFSNPDIISHPWVSPYTTHLSGPQGATFLSKMIDHLLVRLYALIIVRARYLLERCGSVGAIIAHGHGALFEEGLDVLELAEGMGIDDGIGGFWFGWQNKHPRDGGEGIKKVRRPVVVGGMAKERTTLSHKLLKLCSAPVLYSTSLHTEHVSGQPSDEFWTPVEVANCWMNHDGKEVVSSDSLKMDKGSILAPEQRWLDFDNMKQDLIGSGCCWAIFRTDRGPCCHPHLKVIEKPCGFLGLLDGDSCWADFEVKERSSATLVAEELTRIPLSTLESTRRTVQRKKRSQLYQNTQLTADKQLTEVLGQKGIARSPTASTTAAPTAYAEPLDPPEHLQRNADGNTELLSSDSHHSSSPFTPDSNLPSAPVTPAHPNPKERAQHRWSIPDVTPDLFAYPQEPLSPNTLFMLAHSSERVDEPEEKVHLLPPPKSRSVRASVNRLLIHSVVLLKTDYSPPSSPCDTSLQNAVMDGYSPQLQTALDQATEALRWASRENRPRLVAKCHQYRGYVLQRMGRHEEAYHYFIRAACVGPFANDCGEEGMQAMLAECDGKRGEKKIREIWQEMLELEKSLDKQDTVSSSDFGSPCTPDAPGNSGPNWTTEAKDGLLRQGTFGSSVGRGDLEARSRIAPFSAPRTPDLVEDKMKTHMSPVSSSSSMSLSACSQAWQPTLLRPPRVTIEEVDDIETQSPSTPTRPLSTRPTTPGTEQKMISSPLFSDPFLDSVSTERDTSPNLAHFANTSRWSHSTDSLGCDKQLPALIGTDEYDASASLRNKIDDLLSEISGESTISQDTFGNSGKEERLAKLSIGPRTTQSISATTKGPGSVKIKDENIPDRSETYGERKKPAITSQDTTEPGNINPTQQRCVCPLTIDTAPEGLRRLKTNTHHISTSSSCRRKSLTLKLPLPPSTRPATRPILDTINPQQSKLYGFSRAQTRNSCPRLRRVKGKRFQVPRQVGVSEEFFKNGWHIVRQMLEHDQREAGKGVKPGR